MIEANRSKLGLFVLSGIGLLIAILFALGLRERFSEKEDCTTFFKESVQGLEAGSPVKFKGVPIGRVTDLSIRTGEKLIQVNMEIQVSKLRSTDQTQKRSRTDFDFLRNIDQRVKEGLRCQLEMQGITGLKYIEIDYYKEPKSEIPTPPTYDQKRFVYIPSTPSMMAGLKTSVSETIARIANIDFEKISRELSGSLVELRKRLQDPRIDTLISKLDKTSSHVEQLAGNLNKSLPEKKLSKISDDLASNLERLQNLTTQIDQELKKAKLPETAKSFRGTMNDIGDAKLELTRSLKRMEETLDAITDLVTYLEQDPSSVLTGKNKPPVLPQKK